MTGTELGPALREVPLFPPDRDASPLGVSPGTGLHPPRGETLRDGWVRLPCGPAECVLGSRLSPRGVLPAGQVGPRGHLMGTASGRGVPGPRKPLLSCPPWRLPCGGQEAQLERLEDAGPRGPEQRALRQP